jgi:hypothetical protein
VGCVIGLAIAYQCIGSRLAPPRRRQAFVAHLDAKDWSSPSPLPRFAMGTTHLVLLRSERHLGDSPARGVMVVPVPCRNRSHGPHRVWRVRAGVVRLPACSPGRRARAVEGAHELLAHITLGLVLLISRRHFLVRRENLVRAMLTEYP